MTSFKTGPHMTLSLQKWSKSHSGTAQPQPALWPPCGRLVEGCGQLVWPRAFGADDEFRGTDRDPVSIE
jgi:hypothetical protein